MKRLVLALLLAVPLCQIALPLPVSAAASQLRQGYRLLPKPGEKIPLDAEHYFTYGFASPPKLGNAIMRVEIFNRQGARDTSFQVKGDADMPSMRGAHSSGDQDFVLSRKRVYLLPVRIVMPGDWEVSMTFLKNGKTVLRGSYLFDI